MSKQQKQIMLLLLKMKLHPLNTRVKIDMIPFEEKLLLLKTKPPPLYSRSTQIAIKIERIISREDHPERLFAPIIQLSNTRMASISRSLNKLADEGLIETYFDPEDGRTHCWHLTEAGLRKATGIKREIEKIIEDLDAFKEFI